MSEIDSLCKLLGERQLPYIRNGFGVTWDYYDNPHTADESADGTLIVTGLTPEQAIAVTVGERTCHKKWRSDGYKFCSECGYNITGDYVNYCPICGCKVVDV